MTNNDMGPAFGFMLIGMLAFLILTSITRNANIALITRAMRVLDEFLPETRRLPQDISDSFSYLKDEKLIFGETGTSEDLSW